MFIYNYYGKPTIDSDMTFDDAAAVSDWATYGVLYCIDTGYMDSNEQTFNPKGTASRAIIAMALARMYAE